MMKEKTLFTVCLLAVLLVILSACMDSSGSGTPSSNQSGTNNSSVSTDEEDKTSADDMETSESHDKNTAKENDSSSPSSSSESNVANDSEKNSNSDEKANSDTNTLETNNIHISSGTAAIEYLKQQIKAGSNEDIAFGDMGGILETDEKGSYYTIKLVSKTMRENGGSGTLNIYKVYQDGTYKSRY